MTDSPDTEAHWTGRTDDRPGPDWDPAGIESRADPDADTVTFLRRQGDDETTTAWLTVDAEHVSDVDDWR
jgi:hypothetical protein